MMLLELKSIRVQYSEIIALHEVSLHINEGELVAVIGSNGAGKSTMLRAICGINRLSSGEIWFDGKKISSMKAFKTVEMGISHVPEGRRLFPRMTVYENLTLGAWTKRKDTIYIQQQIEKVYHLFPILKERASQKAETLSGGQAQQCAIGRALMCSPRMIMFDEPSLGVQPNIVARIFENIQQINQQGITVLLVEQNVKRALDLADRAYVLQTGNIVLEGTGTELMKSEMVQKAYLGI